MLTDYGPTTLLLRVRASLGWKTTTFLSGELEEGDMGDAQFFLGMEIRRDCSACSLQLSRKRLAFGIVQKFGMSDAKPKLVPMSTSARLSRAADQPKTDKPFSECVGALLYLSVCTRSDMAHIVGTLSRHMSAPSSV